MLRARIALVSRCTTLCDKVCQWLMAGQGFSLCTPIFSTNKTDRHDITEILLRVALNTIKSNQPWIGVPQTKLLGHVKINVRKLNLKGVIVWFATGAYHHYLFKCPSSIWNFRLLITGHDLDYLYSLTEQHSHVNRQCP